MGGKKMFFGGGKTEPVPMELLISYYKFIDNTLDEMGVNDLETSHSLIYNDALIDKSIIRSNHSTKLRAKTNNAFEFTDGSGMDLSWTINCFHTPEYYAFGTVPHKTLMSRSSNSTNIQIELGVIGSGVLGMLRMYLRMYSDASNFIEVRSDSFSGSIKDIWRSFTITYDGSQSINGIEFYYDHKRLSKEDLSFGTYSGMWLINDKTHFLTSKYSTQNAFLVFTDEISVWDNVLTEGQIKTLVKNQKRGNPLPV